MFTDDMIAMQKVQKNLHQKKEKKRKEKLGQIKIITRLQDTRLIYKSIAFLYVSNEQIEFKIKNTILYILPPPKNDLIIKLTNYIQDLCKRSAKL